MWMRRKNLSEFYSVSIRLVDYVISDMRNDPRYKKSIVNAGRAVLVDPDKFFEALKERNS